MSGRIRSIKPEWLEDEKLSCASLEARLLSVGLLLLADDYGRGRAHPGYLGSQVFPTADDWTTVASDAMAQLEAIGFVVTYEVRGQRYFEVRNWAKHQRVDKPGKPRVPAPDAVGAEMTASAARVAYFIRGRTTGLIKIGESVDPVARLAELGRQASEALDLMAVGGAERELHTKLAAHRVHGEWFRCHEDVLREIRERGGDFDHPIASVEYHGRNYIANRSGVIPESFAPDLRSGSGSGSPTSDQEEEGEGGEPKSAPPHNGSAQGALKLEPTAPPPAVVVEIPMTAGRTCPVTEPEVATLRELYPAVDIRLELQRIVDWLRRNPEKRNSTERGVHRRIASWLKTEHEKAIRGGRISGAGQAPAGRDGQQQRPPGGFQPAAGRRLGSRPAAPLGSGANQGDPSNAPSRAGTAPPANARASPSGPVPNAHAAKGDATGTANTNTSAPRHDPPPETLD